MFDNNCHVFLKGLTLFGYLGTFVSRYIYAGIFCKKYWNRPVIQITMMKVSEGHPLVFYKLLQYRYIRHEILFHAL